MQLDDEMHHKLFMICHRELTYGMCQKLVSTMTVSAAFL